MSILSDTKYKTTVFSDDAKFYWNYEDRFKAAKINSSIFKDYKEDNIEDQAKPLGKILLRFITDLTNDSTMYSSGRGEGGNNLQKFLNEYFGLTQEDLKKLGGLSFPGYDDVNKNTPTADDMATPTTCLWRKIVEVPSLKDVNDVRRSISKNPQALKKLIFKGKNRADDKTEYFYYIDTKSNVDAYFLRMDSFFFDSKTIKINGAPTKEPSKIELVKIGISRNENSIKDNTKIKGEIGTIFNVEKAFADLDVNYRDVFVLVKSEDNEPFLEAGTVKISQLPGFKRNLKEVSEGKIVNL